jgi:hypothetical protein
VLTRLSLGIGEGTGRRGTQRTEPPVNPGLFRPKLGGDGNQIGHFSQYPVAGFETTLSHRIGGDAVTRQRADALGASATLSLSPPGPNPRRLARTITQFTARKDEALELIEKAPVPILQGR